MKREMLTKPAVAMHQIDHVPTLLILASMHIDLRVSRGLSIIDQNQQIGRRTTLDDLNGSQGRCYSRIVELLIKGAMYEEIDIPVCCLCWIRSWRSYTCKESL